MCLALFNRVPRLKDSDGKLKDVDGSELLTNSPLTVLRRGTGHGFAELCFIAQDQNVIWLVGKLNVHVKTQMVNYKVYSAT